MSDSDPPLTPDEVLGQLKSIGTPDDEEEISKTTHRVVEVVIEDAKTPGYRRSFLAIIGLISAKHTKVNKRLLRLEMLVVFCWGAVAALVLADKLGLFGPHK